jgi:hypothetical protein
MSAAEENERERNEPPVASEAELGPESKAGAALLDCLICMELGCNSLA